MIGALLFAPNPTAAQPLPLGPNSLVLGAASDAMLCGVDLLDGNAAGVPAECASPVARFRMIFPPTVVAEWTSDGPHDQVWAHRGDLLDGLDELDFGAIPAVDRQAILDGIPAEGWTTGATVTLPLLALTRGGIGVAISKAFQFEGTLPRDIVELLLEGRDPDRSNYDVDDFDLSVIGVTRYSVGYARPVDDRWTVGGSVSLHTGTVNGYYEASPVTIDPVEETAGFDIVGGFAGGAILDGSLFGFRSPDGLGFSLDVGARYARGPLTVAFGVENLLSAMAWPDRTILITTRVAAAADGTVTTETVRDTFETGVAAIGPVRAGIEAYDPALRIRPAVAYEMGVATVGLGAILEPGDGRLYATGGGWDLGVAVHPWRPVDLQLSLGRWRETTTLGIGLTLVAGNFLFQGGLRRGDTGEQLGLSIALAR